MNHPVQDAAEPAAQTIHNWPSDIIAHRLIVASILVLVSLTLLVSATSVRFEVTAPGLVSLPNGAPAPTDLPLTIRGHLIYEPVAEGLLLRVDGKRVGHLHWEHPASVRYDRLRFTGIVNVTGIAPEIRPHQEARLQIVQTGEDRTFYRLVEQWPTSVTNERFEHIIKIPDPARPIRISLAITARSGQMVLQRLMVDGLDPRATVQGARWALLAAWIGLILGALHRLARPMPPALRYGLWTAVAFLMTGILAPPELLSAIKAFVEALVPYAQSSKTGPDLNVFGHFTLFAALTALLLHGRPDLGWLKLFAILAALAMATELMQLLTDGRTADWLDIAVDLAGVGIAAVAVGFIRRLRSTALSIP